MNDNAGAGASHAGKTCRLAFGQGTPDEKRHVGAGRDGKDRSCYRELDKDCPFGNEGQVCQEWHAKSSENSRHANANQGPPPLVSLVFSISRSHPACTRLRN
ncbi:hypothetical protein M798_07705 [Brucella melitensis ADMAS-G1]|nr:hypothetical protein M798_07705 [Brucella melitensis ADMAS-G1]